MLETWIFNKSLICMTVSSPFKMITSKMIILHILKEFCEALKHTPPIYIDKLSLYHQSEFISCTAHFKREKMDPSFSNHSEEIQDLFELHQTSNSILNTVESLLPWGGESNTQFFEDLSAVIGADLNMIELEEENLQESVNISDIHHNSAGDLSTEIFTDPTAVMTYDESIASPNIMLTHNIHENSNAHDIIQENSFKDINSLLEGQIKLDLLSDERHTDINIRENFSSTSLIIDEPTMTPNETMASPILTSKITKKRKRSSGKPSCDILKTKLSNEDMAMASTSGNIKSRNSKKRKIEKLAQDMPIKMDMFENMTVVNSKKSWLDKSTCKTNALCEAVYQDNHSLDDFASVKIQIVKCDKNYEIARRICFRKSPSFHASMKQMLKNKVIDILKIGNNVISEYFIVHYSAKITITVRVRNSCLISAEVTNELTSLCNQKLLNDVMDMLNDDSSKNNM